jgi:hypothetical protein
MEENKWDLISENLDRIKKLGYYSYFNWKQFFCISYEESNPNDSITPLLYYSYYNQNVNWEDAILQCIDVFYSWYYEKGIEANNYIKEGNEYMIEDIGDVSDRVNRELNLTDILDEKKKWDF